MSLTQAARQLKRHPTWTRGAVDTLGIKLILGGKALLMTDKDYQKLVKMDAKLRAAEKAERKPEAATA